MYSHVNRFERVEVAGFGAELFLFSRRVLIDNPFSSTHSGRTCIIS